jgi:LmbE family N-acetylglucosaminyl deacetylase
MKDLSRVLVVAAHPDDEMLGCGGTLARLRAGGARVRILLLGEGPLARATDPESRNAADRLSVESALAAAASLGITDVRFAGLPDNRFDSLPLLDIIKIVEACGADFAPECVFTHHANDLNLDHAITHRAVLTAFRPLPGDAPLAILSFEVLSSTEYSSRGMGDVFFPTLYIDISSHLEAKLLALQAYSSEMRPWPHPRSHEAVEHLARLRGSQCGKDAAEAFILCRGVL